MSSKGEKRKHQSDGVGNNPPKRRRKLFFPYEEDSLRRELVIIAGKFCEMANNVLTGNVFCTFKFESDQKMVIQFYHANNLQWEAESDKINLQEHQSSLDYAELFLRQVGYGIWERYGLQIPGYAQNPCPSVPSASAQANPSQSGPSASAQARPTAGRIYNFLPSVQ